MAGRFLAMTRRYGNRSVARHHITTCEDAISRRHHLLIDDNRTVRFKGDLGIAGQQFGVDILPKG